MKKYYRNKVRKAKYGKVITGISSKAGQKAIKAAYGHRAYGREDLSTAAGDVRRKRVQRLLARGMSMSEVAKMMRYTISQLRSYITGKSITGA